MLTPILQTLRKECGPIHEELHHHGLLAPLSSPNITKEDFNNIIKAFYIAYLSSEKMVSVDIPEDLPNAPVLKWLEADMSFHHLETQGFNLGFPAIDNKSKLLGYLYTKQGSTLGGQVISKHLQKYLGLNPGVDNYFFSGYGDATGKNWKDYMAYLDNSASELNLEEVVEAAKHGFTNIKYSCDFLLKNIKTGS